MRNQIMASLPTERFSFSPPFTYTGIDFAGPFDIKSFSGRNCRITKGYTCVFVCFSTKSIHLEGVSDLSTQAFLAAFSRFISRRGLPKEVFSDHGTNFVGADNALKKDFQALLATAPTQISKKFSIQGLIWNFIPPGAPHMGGLWEAGVRSFKTHFKKIIGTQKFTFEEFSTILARIEACLNSRPISPISENPDDLVALTPGHFLRGGPLISAPEPEVPPNSLTILNRWEKVKLMHQEFCRRWKDEYLKELHKRYKWQTSEPNVTINDLVIVKNENLPSTEWRLGRVVKAHKGADGKVRVVTIRTKLGEITRPIVKICVLPLQPK